MAARLALAVLGILAVVLAPPTLSQALSAGAPVTDEQRDAMLHRHENHPGALAPDNLKKPRPRPPFDLTGTWLVDQESRDFLFGPPYPEFYAEAKRALEEAAEARARGESYRDSIGQCYPPGLPMIMARPWPIAFIQLPTAIYMVAGFENSFRTIYLDGREHSDPDLYVPTFNGESIGHWEGKTLVVVTRGFETDHHWIDIGIPISEEFRVVERIRIINGGKTLRIDYVMTDPRMWKGEWRSTGRWDRHDHADIGEVTCVGSSNVDSAKR